MKKRYQNAFFAFGLVVLIVMVTQLDFRQVWEGVNHAGYWFLAVILLWGILYIANTYSWYLIIDSIGNEQHVCRRHHIGFWWLYKITVFGFALNYATPGGLMGGEPDSYLQSFLAVATGLAALCDHPADDSVYDRRPDAGCGILHPCCLVFYQRI